MKNRTDKRKEEHLHTGTSDSGKVWIGFPNWMYDYVKSTGEMSPKMNILFMSPEAAEDLIKMLRGEIRRVRSGDHLPKTAVRKKV